MTRRANTSDLSALMEALVRFAQFAQDNPHYEFAKGWDLALAYANLSTAILQVDDTNRVYRIGGYLVFCDLVTPWYSSKPILQEWFTIKVGQGGVPLEDIPAVLVQQARIAGAVGVMGGDSSPSSVMAAAYEKANFTPLTKAYFKGT